MNKYVIVKDNTVKRVLVSHGVPSIDLKHGEDLRAVGKQKVKRGDKIFFEQQKIVLPSAQKKRVSIKDVAYGAALLIASAAAIYYFIGSV